MSAPTIMLEGRLALLFLIGASGAGAAWAALHSARLQRWAADRAAQLDASLRRMLLPAYGNVILSAQGTLCLFASAAALALRTPVPLALAAIGVVAPKPVIEFMHKRRRRKIEEKLDGFALALANATRATPSIGRALHMLRPTLTAPLDREIEQVLKEMRVGSSAEEALLALSARVDSPVLDALLSNLLIARRVGGELPVVLETTASTLREMARLEGVLRSKTSQARTQMWVLCSAPVVLIVAFNAIKPGYFDTMIENPIGIALLIAAGVLWLAAIMLARKILAVEL